MGDGKLIANRYEILNTIGQGGMGDVFRGQDRQTGGIVAIKLLKPDIVDDTPDLLERFQREGEALRRLDHPNIVKMLAAVEEDGMHYLVMEYVGSGSLRDLLDKHPQLPVDQVLSIGIELADALTRAHHLKIIHRDLKPENVLLTEDSTPLLTDFGVARIGTQTRVTETGSVIGTYMYLSPESCLGKDLDVRTDIWSFGVMLFEMLAGQRPFDAEQSTAVLLAIINDPVPDLAALRPDVPPGLVDLINRMLQKERDQRIPSVRLVGAALEALREGVDSPLPDQIPLPGQPGSRFATPTPTREQEPLVIFTPPSSAPSSGPSSGPSAPPATPAAAPARRKMSPWALAGIAGVLIIVAALAVVLGLFDGESKESGISAPDVHVEPVGPGEYMVLVAQLEPLEGAERGDISRFIVEDLRQHLEVEIPFSNIRIRAYPAIIASEADAQAAAQTNGASVIVWGNYSQDDIQLSVEIGSTDAFPLIRIDRTTLERTADVRVRMRDEHNESVVAPVLSALNVLHTADGSGFEITRILAIMDALEVTHAEIVSGGVAGYFQRAALVYVEDTGQAIEEYTGAIDLQGGNPLPYAFRAAGYLRLGQYDKAMRDIETARRLGPKGWTTPLYMEGVHATLVNDFDGALAILNQIVEQRPEDWFAINYRGALYYLRGDYDLAKADLQRAIELGPSANFPYLMANMIALHEGRLTDLQNYLGTTLSEFPDPTFSNRLIVALYGDQVPHIFVPMFSAAGSVVLGQYEQVITDTQAALAINDQLPDMYLLQGLAYCNLRDYAASEAAYTRGIEIAPDFVALHALRAEVRIRQEDVLGSAEDIAFIMQSDQADMFAPVLEDASTGKWNCERFFDYDYGNKP